MNACWHVCYGRIDSEISNGYGQNDYNESLSWTLSS